MEFNLSKKNLYGIKTSHTNNLVSHVLLRTFGLGSEQGGDSSTGKGSTDAVTASLSELVNYGRVLLAETAGVEEDGLVIAFEPAHAPEALLGRGENAKGRQGSMGLGEHHIELV